MSPITHRELRTTGRTLLTALTAGSSCSQSRHGFSLVEVLVVIGILGGLVALLLPAVQSVREGARRSACLNNTREIANAITQLVTRDGAFPRERYAGDFSIINKGFVGETVSVFAQLLPMLATQEIYDALFSQQADHRIAKDKNFKVFLCPSDLDRFQSSSTTDSHGHTNYRGNVGNLPIAPSFDDGALKFRNNGIFVTGQNHNRISSAHVVDGLSQTALLTERRLGDDNDAAIEPGSDWFAIEDMRPPNPNPNNIERFTSPDAVYSACEAATPQAGSQSQVSQSGISWFRIGYLNSYYNHVAPPNGCSCAVRIAGLGSAPLLESLKHDNGGNATAPTSRHPGGVAFALCDGSTRFLADGIDLGVWRALGSRNGSGSEAVIPDDWR